MRQGLSQAFDSAGESERKSSRNGRRNRLTLNVSYDPSGEIVDTILVAVQAIELGGTMGDSNTDGRGRREEKKRKKVGNRSKIKGLARWPFMR
jgi:hypothetical protein